MIDWFHSISSSLSFMFNCYFSWIWKQKLKWCTKFSLLWFEYFAIQITNEDLDCFSLYCKSVNTHVFTPIHLIQSFFFSTITFSQVIIDIFHFVSFHMPMHFIHSTHSLVGGDVWISCFHISWEFIAETACAFNGGALLNVLLSVLDIFMESGKLHFAQCLHTACFLHWSQDILHMGARLFFYLLFIQHSNTFEFMSGVSSARTLTLFKLTNDLVSIFIKLQLFWYLFILIFIYFDIWLKFNEIISYFK